MFRFLLVTSLGSELDDPVFQTALRAADPSSAHIEFLHVRMDASQIVLGLAGTDLGGVALRTSIADLEQQAAEREQRAREGFQALCAKHGLKVDAPPNAPGISATLRTVTGEELAYLVDRARTADAVVMGRRRERKVIALELLESALVDVGRPLLVAPANPPENLCGTVAIAWKGRPEAARAVTAAMPFIRQAEQVVILSVSENGEDDPSCERLRQALRWHNPNVGVRYLARDRRAPAEILLDEAKGPAVAATLLVMGGYGHGRLREAIFGGFTRRALTDAAVPVLIAH